MLPQSVCILYRRTINKVNGDYNELNRLWAQERLAIRR